MTGYAENWGTLTHEQQSKFYNDIVMCNNWIRIFGYPGQLKVNDNIRPCIFYPLPNSKVLSWTGEWAEYGENVCQVIDNHKITGQFIWQFLPNKGCALIDLYGIDVLEKADEYIRLVALDRYKEVEGFKV